MKLIEYEINKHLEGRDLGLAFSASVRMCRSQML
jgi:hypothetical protein